jgi:hypothetical protein
MLVDIFQFWYIVRRYIWQLSSEKDHTISLKHKEQFESLPDWQNLDKTSHVWKEDEVGIYNSDGQTFNFCKWEWPKGEREQYLF